MDTGSRARLVLEQLLCADLRDAGAGGLLPDGVAALHREPLPGRFLLQVDEVVNVAAAWRDRYKTARPGDRCLKLRLTDGRQTLAAIEHAPVPELQVHMPAGTKVVVNGAFVRRGLLLLQPQTVSVLGGCVPRLEEARQRMVEHWSKPADHRQQRANAQQMYAEAAAAAWAPPAQGQQQGGQQEQQQQGHQQQQGAPPPQQQQHQQQQPQLIGRQHELQQAQAPVLAQPQRPQPQPHQERSLDLLQAAPTGGGNGSSSSAAAGAGIGSLPVEGDHDFDSFGDWDFQDEDPAAAMLAPQQEQPQRPQQAGTEPAARATAMGAPSATGSQRFQRTLSVSQARQALAQDQTQAGAGISASAERTAWEVQASRHRQAQRQEQEQDEPNRGCSGQQQQQQQQQPAVGQQRGAVGPIGLVREMDAIEATQEGCNGRPQPPPAAGGAPAPLARGAAASQPRPLGRRSTSVLSPLVLQQTRPGALGALQATASDGKASAGGQLGAQAHQQHLEGRRQQQRQQQAAVAVVDLTSLSDGEGADDGGGDSSGGRDGSRVLEEYIARRMAEIGDSAGGGSAPEGGTEDLGEPPVRGRHEHQQLQQSQRQQLKPQPQRQQLEEEEAADQEEEGAGWLEQQDGGRGAHRFQAGPTTVNHGGGAWSNAGQPEEEEEEDDDDW